MIRLSFLRRSKDIMVYLETPRLILRDWTDDDRREFRQMNSDQRVMEFFPSTLTAAQSDRFFELIQNELKTHCYGLYAAQTKHDGRFIGFIGLHRAEFPSDFTPCVEIGWRLCYDAWGYGYATEGASACLQYGFKATTLHRIYSFTAVINTRSENVMKRIGMVKVREFDHPSMDRDSPLKRHVLYAADATNT